MAAVRSRPRPPCPPRSRAPGNGPGETRCVSLVGPGLAGQRPASVRRRSHHRAACSDSCGAPRACRLNGRGEGAACRICPSTNPAAAAPPGADAIARPPGRPRPDGALGPGRTPLRLRAQRSGERPGRSRASACRAGTRGPRPASVGRRRGASRSGPAEERPPPGRPPRPPRPTRRPPRPPRQHPPDPPHSRRPNRSRRPAPCPTPSTSIPLDAIDADALARDRTRHDPDALHELRLSIAASGLRMPVEVFELAEPRRPAPLRPDLRLPPPRRLPRPRRDRPRQGASPPSPPSSARPRASPRRSPPWSRRTPSAPTSPPGSRRWSPSPPATRASSTPSRPPIDALYANLSRNKRHRLRAIAHLAEELDGRLPPPRP